MLHVVIGAAVGAVIGGLSSLVVAKLRGQKVSWRSIAAGIVGGAVAGAVTAATFGAGAPQGAALGGSVAAELTGYAAGGALGAASQQATENALEGRPVGEGVGTAFVEGAVSGVVLGEVGQRVVGPVVTKAVNAAKNGSRGVVGALQGRQPGAVLDDPLPAGARELPKARAPETTSPTNGSARAPPATGKAGAYASVHPSEPGWLSARMSRAVADVRAGRAVEGADPAKVASFLHETYEHVDEVNALIKALGGKARPLPRDFSADDALRGVHDFGERVSLRRFEEFVKTVRENPLKNRQGETIPVPAWLDRFIAEARASGQPTVDVGKLNPYVASGLGRDGAPETYALAVHNLSPHHDPTALKGNALIEAIADRVNAMRQVRVYRPQPMPFEKIRQFLMEDVTKGSLPPEAGPLVERAIEAEVALEASGRVNPYHLVHD